MINLAYRNRDNLINSVTELNCKFTSVDADKIQHGFSLT